MYTPEVLALEAAMQGDLEGFGAAPRSWSLAGKRVGLVWNAKRGGDVALDRVGQQRKAHRIRTKGHPWTRR